ncbi:transcriptional regulatory protein TyrR [Microbulbifer aestuariivivens]|uniref:Transcriptional regulatory protein TyrR n=2 Tax=Microbulbifer aestuariivivens TaxID=1908308 RepID=A0ABP9WQ29_9GAMM
MGIFFEYRVNVVSGELGGDSGDKVYLWVPGLLQTQYRAIEKALGRVAGIRQVRRIALMPSERRHFELDTLLRHVAEPVLSVDSAGRVVAANLAAARAFAVSLEHMAGLQLQRFLPGLPLQELLRDLTAPRYGIPVTLRGRAFQLEWVPIPTPIPERTRAAKANARPPSKPVPLEIEAGAQTVASLAGAVVTLTRDSGNAHSDTADGSHGRGGIEGIDPIAELPILWDFGRRRETCLQLQEMSALQTPLLISGEAGTGKTTFSRAVHHLSPLAAAGRCVHWRCAPGRIPTAESLPPCGTLILDDLHGLNESDTTQLLRLLQLYSRRFSPELRLVGTCRDVRALPPGLAQCFSSLTLHLPPLRLLRDALPRFANVVLREMGSAPEGLSSPCLSQLMGHDWPGNFTELKDHLSAAVGRWRRRQGDANAENRALSRGAERAGERTGERVGEAGEEENHVKLLQPQDLPGLAPVSLAPWRDWGSGMTYREIMQRVERELLLELRQSYPSTRELGARLGLSHTAVANKLRSHGLAGKTGQ